MAQLSHESPLHHPNHLLPSPRPPRRLRAVRMDRNWVKLARNGGNCSFLMTFFSTDEYELTNVKNPIFAPFVTNLTALNLMRIDLCSDVIIRHSLTPIHSPLPSFYLFLTTSTHIRLSSKWSLMARSMVKCGIFLQSVDLVLNKFSKSV